MDILVKKQLKTIGLFIDSIDNPFQFQMLEGIKAAAKNCGNNLFCFVGGALQSPVASDRARNFIYEYANSSTIDGLIIMSTPVGNFVSLEYLNKFREQFKNLPVVSISQPLVNAYTVQIDNYIGLKQLIKHLIQEHGYKNIAVIKGPESNTEAQERFSAYKDCLAEHNIPYNEELVMQGMFNEQSGYNAAMQLIAKKNIKVDAVVAVNDDMAFGAIKAFEEKNINVPYEIAVVGFDDQIQCSYVAPSLTTVKMPIFELGFQSVGTLNNLFESKPIDRNIKLPTHPVIRESCGCVINSHLQLIKYNNQLTALKINKLKGKLPLAERFALFFNNGLQQRFTAFTYAEIEEFSKIFISSVRHLDTESLLNYFSSLINKHNLKVKETDFLLRFFIEQKTYILDFFENNVEKVDADEKLQLLCEYLLDYIEKTLNYNKVKLEREFINSRRFGGELIVCSNTEEIIVTLLQLFSILDIGIFYFALYDGDNKEQDIKKSKLKMILAYHNKKPLVIDAHEHFNPYETLVPDCYLDKTEQWSLIIDPLFFGSIKLGLAIFNMNSHGYIDYVMHRRILSDTLNYIVYIQRILNQSRNLESAYNELTETLDILSETQEKLIQSEKMSVIGSLVAGISHEINTPIGISVTASSHLEQLTNNLNVLFKANDMKKSDLQNYLAAASEISTMILSNLGRANDLIRSFKQVAVDQTIDEVRKFNVKEYLDQILLSLKPALKKSELIVNVLCPEELEITSYPGAFYQILTNLIMNSTIHGYDLGQNGKITIEFTAVNSQVILKYMDDGKGINPGIVDKIFDPFFTTKRGQGGTGLGLHIVNNLVRQKLNGTIKCSSSIGKGVLFTFTFPINVADS